MIHDTFKHDIFNLINFLRTKKLSLIKNCSMPNKTCRTIPRILCLWCCKSQTGPGSCSSTTAGTKWDFINARLVPLPAFPWDLGHRGQSYTKEDRNETWNCCIIFIISIWKEVLTTVLLYHPCVRQNGSQWEQFPGMNFVYSYVSHDCCLYPYHSFKQ